MSHWKNYPAEIMCDECDGMGEIECSCCGSTLDCDECKGTGLNELVDRAALEAFWDAHKHHGGTSELVESELWVGRKCCTCGATIRYLDHLVGAQ